MMPKVELHTFLGTWLETDCLFTTFSRLTEAGRNWRLPVVVYFERLIDTKPQAWL
jgi:hypothetical protein